MDSRQISSNYSPFPGTAKSTICYYPPLESLYVHIPAAVKNAFNPANIFELPYLGETLFFK